MSFNFNTPPVTARTAGTEKPSPGEKTEPRAQLRGKQPQSHQRWHSTGVRPVQQLKIEQAEPPLKKGKVSNAELIDRFVTWLRGDDGGRQVDETLIDQLAQAVNVDLIRKLIPQINQFTSEDIKTALGNAGRIDTGTPKSRDLYMMCLGALFAREDALKALEQPVLSLGPVSVPSEKPSPGSVKEKAKTYQAKVDASKTAEELKAEGAQVIKEYVKALAVGDEQAAAAPMKRLAAITDRIVHMHGAKRHTVITEVIGSWIKGLGLADRPDEEKLNIYRYARDFRFANESVLVRQSLMDSLASDVNEVLAKPFIQAGVKGGKVTIREAAEKLQNDCAMIYADLTEEDREERLELILEAYLKDHPLSAEDAKTLRTNLRHRSGSAAVKILHGLVKGESKAPTLKQKLQDLASSIPSPRSPRSPRSPFNPPKTQALAASTPAQPAHSLAASARPAPEPDAKPVEDKASEQKPT